jgi:hypothetical protein
MSARRTNRRKVSLLSTTVRADTWPSRGRQLNPVFSPFRWCKSKFYAGCRLFSENSCGDTSAGMEVFLEMGGMPVILAACTSRSRSLARAATRPACHQSWPLAPPALPPTHAAAPLSLDPGPSSGQRQVGGRAHLAERLRKGDQPQRQPACRKIMDRYAATIPYGCPHEIGILPGSTVSFF